jgi:5-methylcytosine-specific restriction protein A
MKQVDPFYVSKEWESIRHQVLKRDKYICQNTECGALCLGKKRGNKGKGTDRSPHVDHIEERKLVPGKALDMGNLQVLCDVCHGRKTGLTNASRGKPKIGADGYPIDPIPDKSITSPVERGLEAMRKAKELSA